MADCNSFWHIKIFFWPTSFSKCAHQDSNARLETCLLTETGRYTKRLNWIRQEYKNGRWKWWSKGQAEWSRNMKTWWNEGLNDWLITGRVRTRTKTDVRKKTGKWDDETQVDKVGRRQFISEVEGKRRRKVNGKTIRQRQEVRQNKTGNRNHGQAGHYNVIILHWTIYIISKWINEIYLMDYNSFSKIICVTQTRLYFPQFG